MAITAGPDGNLWYTETSRFDFTSNELFGGKISRITTAGVVTEFPVPGEGGSLQGIVVGPDGNLWFTKSALAGAIGQVALANLGPPTDVTVTLIAGPDPVTLGLPLTDTLTATNRGPSRATGVTLIDTIPAGTTFVSASDGGTLVEGILTFHLGDLAAGASATVTVTVTPAAAGMLTNRAAVGADQFELSPADNAVALTTTVVLPSIDPPLIAPPVVSPPLVVGVQRFGVHAQPTVLVVNFSDPLDPDRAQNAGNYRIVRHGGPRRAGSRVGRTIRVRAVVYDPAVSPVTLFPAARLGVHHTYQLTITGTPPMGLTDAFGVPRDGDADGQAGGHFVSRINRSTLAGNLRSRIGRIRRERVARQFSGGVRDP